MVTVVVVVIVARCVVMVAVTRVTVATRLLHVLLQFFNVLREEGNSSFLLSSSLVVTWTGQEIQARALDLTA